MIWKSSPLAILGLAMIGAPIVAQAKIYISIEQAQKILFPNKTLTKTPIIITDDLQEKMRTASSIRHPFQGERIWKSSDGAWLIIDEVVGKHEMITYGLGIDHFGNVKEVQILQYNESYGHQIRELSWRKQFIDKNSIHKIRLNEDIENISGATLSCKHVTDGIRRLMALHSLLLKKLKSHDRL